MHELAKSDILARILTITLACYLVLPLNSYQIKCHTTCRPARQLHLYTYYGASAEHVLYSIYDVGLGGAAGTLCISLNNIAGKSTSVQFILFT